jgi:hypothetical protein
MNNKCKKPGLLKVVLPAVRRKKGLKGFSLGSHIGGSATQNIVLI